MPGSLMDKRVVILRRAVIPDDGAGNTRGDFEPAGNIWCQFHTQPGRQISEGGAAADLVVASVYVRINTFTLSITSADRARVLSQDYAIVSVRPPNRKAGTIALRLGREMGLAA
ncbi:Phage head-tail joining protein [Rhizobiales bacterium GAS188]|nr:Phage head-tail joining protein [Rhizobiales bacterium GAS188]